LAFDEPEAINSVTFAGMLDLVTLPFHPTLLAQLL
jgi:hypothetical protein